MQKEELSDLKQIDPDIIMEKDIQWGVIKLNVNQENTKKTIIKDDY